MEDYRFGGNGRRDCARHRLEKGIGWAEAMRGWRGKRRKIPATPRLICSSARLFSSRPPYPSPSPPSSCPSPVQGIHFSEGLCIVHVHACTGVCDSHVFYASRFCICTSRYIGIGRRGWSRMMVEREGGKLEETTQDHRERVSYSCVSAQWYLVMFSLFLRIHIILSLPSLINCNKIDRCAEIIGMSNIDAAKLMMQGMIHYYTNNRIVQNKIDWLILKCH